MPPACAAGRRCWTAGAAWVSGRAATAVLRQPASPAIVRDLLAGHRGGFQAVAVTVGPGSFTGLRGALALAHGLALGAGVPVVGVRVAEALLHGVVHAGPVWVALDSRRTGRIFLDTGEGMASVLLDALPPAPASLLVLGDGADLVRLALPEVTVNGQAVSPCRVGQVALRRLTGAIGGCDASPLYVEPPAARE